MHASCLQSTSVAASAALDLDYPSTSCPAPKLPVLL